MIRIYEGYMHFSMEKVNDNYIAEVERFCPNRHTPIYRHKKSRAISDPASLI